MPNLDEPGPPPRQRRRRSTSSSSMSDSDSRRSTSYTHTQDHRRPAQHDDDDHHSRRGREGPSRDKGSTRRRRSRSPSSSHRSESARHHLGRARQRSPPPSHFTASHQVRARGPLPPQSTSFAAVTDPHSAAANPTDTPAVEKQAPNFAPTGALAAETNTVGAIVLKYNEPPEARKPPVRDAWRLYVFKGIHELDMLELAPRSCWLVGRERAVADLPVEHPSCSKQHAVLQFRFVHVTNEFGDRDGRVRPYIIDLESANGTLVNGDKIPPTRYVELRDQDMIQFGLSTREYILMLPPGD